jgi:hypothetical protein
MRHHHDAFVPPHPARPARLEQPEDLAGPALGRSHTARGLIALQKSVGNQAVAQVMRPGAARTVARCGAGECTDCGPAQGEEAQALAQGTAGNEDEYASLGQAVVQRSIGDRDGRRAVQRVATFSAGPVHEVTNLAEAAITGAAPGLTLPALNGTNLMSGAAARTALVHPTVLVTAVPAGGFDAVIDTVPTNNGSFDETVLAAPPWRFDTTKSAVQALFPTLTSCSGAGATRFRAYGDPSDAAMFAANRRHEDHHAADHRAVFDATIVPWDQKITQAKAAGTRFHGATAADAEAALWAAMGGTPDQIANAYWTQCLARGGAFHSTPAGGPISAGMRPEARNACSISWAYFHNPS